MSEAGSADGDRASINEDGAADGDDGARALQRSLQALVWDPAAIYELQGLPLVYAKAPLLWIPRALRDRVCAILCGLLQDAVQPRDAELANLLLFHSGQLLLRVPHQSADEDEASVQQEDIPTRGADGRCMGESECAKMQGIVARVRERVALAEKGAWGQLVHALYTETQAHALKNRTPQREEATGPNAVALVDAPAGELAWDAST